MRSRRSKSNLSTSTASNLSHLPSILMEAHSDSGPMGDTGDALTPRRKLVIPDIEPSPTLDFLIEERDNEDGGHHDHSSSSYDEMSMTNNRPGYSEVVSLTLDEIAWIRGALAKAELENLEEQDQRLFDNVRQQKICFSCKRVKFGTWWMRQSGVKCHLCQNTICTACCRQMVLPCAQLDRIPVHTLSPALEPDQQDERHLRDNIPLTPSPNRDKRMIASSTVPRQKLQRSMTHDFTTCATMPKAQTRQRLPLRDGLAMSTQSSPLPRPPATSFNHSPLQTAQRRKISLPSEETALLIQVCIECHNVLYHAIMESQAERFSLHSARVHQLTGGLDTRQRRPLPLRRATMTELGPLSTAASYHTSASSVISDSQSDSLDEDFNAADMEDFLEDIQAHARQSELLQAESVSPAASRSDSTNSETGSFYSNHI
ncbi:hypothetical protein RvY_15032-2 [Ramazzottius varieornatus]|uniref:Uncharacterized protein n=1 Tax=Ramazzottius varieornatus TaxID=947166 RepID=A0A1D1VTF7_RAMVA|nr:hypothetical protein RvY_15032-2 [Ramazzottius varieornatus]